MTDVSPQVRDSKRVTALVLAWVSLIPMALLLLMLLFIMLTASGPTTTVAVIPIAGILFTGWIWGLVALIALLVVREARRPGLPYLLSSPALAQVLIGTLIATQQ